MNDSFTKKTKKGSSLSSVYSMLWKEKNGARV